MTIREHASKVIAQLYSRNGSARVFPDWSDECRRYVKNVKVDADILFTTVQQLLKEVVGCHTKS